MYGVVENIKRWIKKCVYDASKILCEIIQQSKRNIGSHTLAVNEEIQWSFRLNFGESTLFFCQFWWAGKIPLMFSTNYCMSCLIRYALGWWKKMVSIFLKVKIFFTCILGHVCDSKWFCCMYTTIFKQIASFIYLLFRFPPWCYSTLICLLLLLLPTHTVQENYSDELR